MSNNMSLTNVKAQKGLVFSQMDGLIKFIFALILTIVPFYLQKGLSLGVFVVFLFILTYVSNINSKTLLLSGASYGIIVLLPYLFGLLMNSLFYLLSGNAVFSLSQQPYPIFLRLLRLFIIWYVSILYFHTTPIKTIIGLLDKLLTPLKLLGIPVKDYLKIMMCIIQELTESGAEVKKSLAESMRSIKGDSGRWFKINIKGVSQIIVNLIVNSFEKIDKIQGQVEKMRTEEMYSYRFRVAKVDGVALLSLILLIAIESILEKGYWI